MIRYLSLVEVLELHRGILKQSPGSDGLRDRGILESALAQPQMAFDGVELYHTLAEKAGALGFSLVCNHPFIDGNKRIGHAAMETFLLLNGWELFAGVDEQEQLILQLASGQWKRDPLIAWVQSHMRPFEPLVSQRG